MTIGPREQALRDLRSLKLAGRRSRNLPALKADIIRIAETPALASAVAEPKETTMSKKSKSKKATGPKPKKRSVSEAAANLKAAKKKGDAPKSDPMNRAFTIRPGSKLEIVAGLLKRPEGCTTAEVLAGTGWPTVSMPQMAKAAGLTLRKEKDGKVSRYFGA